MGRVQETRNAVEAVQRPVKILILTEISSQETALEKRIEVRRNVLCAVQRMKIVLVTRSVVVLARDNV